MEQNKQEKLEQALLEFVERASKEGATREEISVLPDVARVLINIIYPNL
ncbi:hypothetical protein [Enterococcus wangshanyuanii]|uniref:Uncharacterized protein n=1 Tax=Enterococcus wangshanyuanii TaxID=2005703 RepID=A0ABQ1PV46_9ENTE|nr:hypothetical protein [Enterococcus wangshanyuanii]GGD04869.1 hypothetical protein GCM10011573_37940 [Enterococcus wangshanyuanii]